MKVDSLIFAGELRGADEAWEVESIFLVDLEAKLFEVSFASDTSSADFDFSRGRRYWRLMDGHAGYLIDLVATRGRSDCMDQIVLCKRYRRYS